MNYESQESADTKKDEKENGEWDISKPFGPTKELTFTTAEGTWMSCDVSPDGQEIVFDLLGDIYSMPITGGKAQALTSGPAWDIQPAFSPDGKKIAFTSDRSGGDNIWTMERDGADPKQVSDEKFRLMNNPVFMPDGRYIIARKHFVKTRSLGAGEMWMYHISGGKGVQLTEKRDWQHDAGEPDISPDGRYLYYSQDVSPGSRYEYNRDPYGTIYAIDRVDLETGEKTRLVSGPGGAATPQISPDGRTLAFVRRVGLKTVLFLKALETGNERPLFDRLNRDAQETWAIFGVHPGYSWTPDGQNIVITAKGGFWKVKVATGEAITIPFTAGVKQTMTKAIRFPVNVGDPEFKVHVARHARVSPGGKKVAFQALGKLYIAGVDGSNRQRLTKGESGFEVQPAWSPDGKHIAYTTWSDEKAGGISIARVDEGTTRKLNIPAGHYFDPAWSPDSKSLVYRKGGGNWLRGYEHGADPGIYIVPVKDGETRFITKEGRKPVFTGDGKRILLLTQEGENQTLISVDLNGKDRRELATSKYAEDMALSPDENWIAFKERYRVYVASFPQTGKPVALSPSMESVPVFRVTHDSGFEVHWSADSKAFYWTLGAELFSRKLQDSFSFVEGAPDSLPEPDSIGVLLGWRKKTDMPKGKKIALIGARIITMDKAGVIEKGTIIIENNRIKAIGSANEVKIPLLAKKIDVTGKTIIPGLVDVHAHMAVNWDGLSSEQNWEYLANLAFGVTTTHDPSNSTEMIFANSELQKAGIILAPRLFSTGTILYGAETPFTAEINSLEDAKSHLRRLKAFGAFTVKSYNQPRRDQRQQVLKAAWDLDMMVYPEGASTFQHNINMIVDGHTGIEHSISVSPLYKDVLTLYGSSGVGYTPTLIVSYGGLWGENYWYQHQKVFEHERLLAYTPRELLDQKRRRRMVEDEDYNYIQNARAAKALADAGVKVNNGAHGQLQGLGVHWEMWMLVQGGMTPLEALKASTINGAHYIGLDGDLGSLAAGKLADLVVLEKNPLEDIQNSDSVEMVMLNGRLYDAATMNEIFLGKRKRMQFWWEKDL